MIILFNENAFTAVSSRLANGYVFMRKNPPFSMPSPFNRPRNGVSPNINVTSLYQSWISSCLLRTKYSKVMSGLETCKSSNMKRFEDKNWSE